MLVRCSWQAPQCAAACCPPSRRPSHRWPSPGPVNFAPRVAAPILPVHQEENIVSQHQHPSPLPSDPERQAGCSPLPPDPESQGGGSPLPPDPQTSPPVIRPPRYRAGRERR